MDFEFHYFATGIIAHAAGFSRQDARTLAYACQFVDENDMTIVVKDRSERLEPFESVITQTMDVTRPRMEQLHIYPAFHFIPGDYDGPTTDRRDGKLHLLNTTPDSPLAREQLAAALDVTDDTRLHRIGIALHAYADTFAHQNFTGMNDTFNGQMMDLKPNIGHADAEHHPDWPGHRWDDDRLVHSEIDNNLRFLAAAGRMYDMLAEHTDTARKDWDRLNQELSLAFGPTSSAPGHVGRLKRLNAYHTLAPWLDAVDTHGEFDDDLWLREAVVQEIRGIKDPGPSFLGSITLFPDRFWWRQDRTPEETDWYLFQRAVRDHMEFMRDRVDTRTERMGLSLFDTIA